MLKRGLILRIIPYSDSARIIKCLVDGEGQQALFTRISKKTGGSGHLQTGHFIEFRVTDKKTGVKSIKESRLDSALGANFLVPQAYGVWLFTLELLNKSLQDNFNIPELTKKMDQYYSHLSHGTIPFEPIIPLIILSVSYGIFDQKNTGIQASAAAHSGLNIFGIQTATNVPMVSFDQILTRFTNHFAIQQIESLDLL